MIRFMAWCFMAAVVAWLFVTGPYWPAIVVAAVAVAILATAEIDEHMTGHRGVSGSFKRTDRMAKR